MLPKKNRRNIIVNNVLYHYIISGSINVVIQNTQTSKIFKHYEDWKPKWQLQMKPSDIKQLILENNV